MPYRGNCISQHCPLIRSKMWHSVINCSVKEKNTNRKKNQETRQSFPFKFEVGAQETFFSLSQTGFFFLWVLISPLCITLRNSLCNALRKLKDDLFRICADRQQEHLSINLFFLSPNRSNQYNSRIPVSIILQAKLGIIEK